MTGNCRIESNILLYMLMLSLNSSGQKKEWENQNNTIFYKLETILNSSPSKYLLTWNIILIEVILPTGGRREGLVKGSGGPRRQRSPKRRRQAARHLRRQGLCRLGEIVCVCLLVCLCVFQFSPCTVSCIEYTIKIKTLNGRSLPRIF